MDAAKSSDQSGEMLLDAEVHDDGYQINDLQMSQDRTYFITAGKDKQAKVFHVTIPTNHTWSPNTNGVYSW